MTVFAYRQATAHGASVSFVPMLVSSVLISLAALVCADSDLYAAVSLPWCSSRKDIDPDAFEQPREALTRRRAAASD